MRQTHSKGGGVGAGSLRYTVHEAVKRVFLWKILLFVLHKSVEFELHVRSTYNVGRKQKTAVIRELTSKSPEGKEKKRKL